MKAMYPESELSNNTHVNRYQTYILLNLGKVYKNTFQRWQYNFMHILILTLTKIKQNVIQKTVYKNTDISLNIINTNVQHLK